MGARLRHKHYSIANLPSKISLPIAIFLCFFCFLIGSMIGGRFQQVPDVRYRPTQTVTNQSNSVSEESLQTGTSEFQRRVLSQISSDSPYLAQPAGESGDGELSIIPYQVLSFYPRALLFPNFASKEICENIIQLAKTKLRPSSLALRKGESLSATKDIRTSSGTFLSSFNDPSGALAWVERKMEKASLIPASHGEPFNVLRYEYGQHYDAHYDTFNPKEYGPQRSHRLASFLLYLSDVEEGGETMFPFENNQNMDDNYDYKKCIGLKVKPKQGDALLFFSLTLNGSFDPTSLHGSCPVIKGQKFVATKWLRNLPLR